MKKILLVVSIALGLTFASCNVQERIIFNQNMGGIYETSFDLSEMLTIAGSSGASQSNKPTKKMDTIITFNEVLVKYKDSIAVLPIEKQKMLAKMKDMTMHMQMDEEAGLFKFDIGKGFSEFTDIEFVSYEIDEMMDLAKNNAAGAAGSGPGGDMLKTEKVRYFFENNTFRRVDEKLLSATDEDAEVKEETEEDMMMKGMMGDFDDMLAESKMTLEYVFPKKVKSVSHEGATISADGMTVIFEVDWKTLMDNKKMLENFEVVLEE